MKLKLKPKLTPIKVEMLMKTIGKLAMLFAFFNLFWILWAIGQGNGFEMFVMKTLQNWLLLLISLVGSILLEVSATHPELRAYFTHLERTPKIKGRTGFFIPKGEGREAALKQLLVQNPEIIQMVAQAIKEAGQAAPTATAPTASPAAQAAPTASAAPAAPQQTAQTKDKRKLPLY